MWSYFRKWLLLICILLLTPILGHTQLPDSLSNQSEISLLIATPSNTEIYTLYGHVALRVHDPYQNIDIAFNYGIFAFDDNFLWKFVKGQTDYIVQAIPTEHYLNEYLQRGSEIKELYLTIDENIRKDIWSYLCWNIQPQNRTYRYNFFYDNCSTRPIQIYANAIKVSNENPHTPHPTGEGFSSCSRKSLKIPIRASQYTWRDVINKLEADHPWLVFSTDLALGAETDRTMSFDEQIFAPHLLEQVLSQSYILEEHFEGCVIDLPSDTLHTPIITRTVTYTPTITQQNKSHTVIDKLFSPYAICLFIFSISLGMFIGVRRKGTYPIVWHYILLVMAGLAGILLFYISILSEHPHRTPNFNLFVLHPLHLLLAVPLMAIPKLRYGAYLYHFTNFVTQCIFLALAYFLPQTFNLGVIYLSLALGILSLSYIYRYRAKRSI